MCRVLQVDYAPPRMSECDLVRRWAISVFLGVAIALTSPVVARAASGTASLSASEVRDFAERSIPPKMAALHVPGAIFVVVYRGEVLLSAGYGFADLETREPVDAKRTLFRVGSVSKCVTATAVMELARRGRIDLERDVRPLVPKLGWTVRHDQPITPIHLLAHSSGLDATDIGDAAREPEQRLSLESYLRSHMTAQVSRPGEFFRYTNHGYALLGYLMELAESRPFAEVVEATVLGPLGMRSSTFEQPLPSLFRPRLAQAYEWRSGAHRALGIDYSNVAPADALVSTADDMATFMLAHLAPNEKVLSPELRARMHRTAFSVHPLLPGRALGFREELVGARREERGDRRLISHTGGQLGFTSELLLYPDAELGLFMVQNLRDYKLRYEIFDEFLTQFFPAKTPALEANALPESDLGKLVGTYQKLPYPASTMEGVGDLLSPAIVNVSLVHGSIRVSGKPELTPVDDRLFVSRDAKTSIAFRFGSAGTASHLFIDGEPYERIAWHQSSRVHLMTVVGSVGASLIGVLGWPIARWIRRRKAVEGTGEKRVGRIAALVCALNLLYVVSFSVVLLRAAASGGFDYGLPPTLVAALWLPIVLVVGGIAAIVSAIFAWRNRYFGLTLRIGLAATALPPILIFAVVWRWHLFGV